MQKYKHKQHTLDFLGGVLSIVMPIWLSISANCFVSTPQLLATFSSHRRWMFILHTSHLRPCLKIPYNREPQWSQNVRRLNECTANLCGMLTLKRWTISCCALFCWKKVFFFEKNHSLKTLKKLSYFILFLWTFCDYIQMAPFMDNASADCQREISF